MNALLLAMFLGQANMGLTVPVPGVTPGPTYATEISNDLILIDAHDHTTGKGVKVPTAGLNINANLSFNGFGATGFNSCTGTACGISNPFTGTFVDLGTVVLDAGEAASLNVRGGQLNAYSGANIDGGITVGGDVHADGGFFEKITVAGPIQEGLATQPLSLKGNGAAATSVGVVLDNLTTQVSGTIASFRSGGTEQASVDFGGDLFLNGVVQETTASTPLALVGNGAANGTGVSIQNNIDVTSHGMALLIKQNGFSQFGISGRAHFVPFSSSPTAPVAGTFAAGFQSTGAVNSISLTGSDLVFILKFTTGTACAAINAGTVLVPIAFANAYSSTAFAGFAGYGKAPASTGDMTPLAVVSTATGSLQIIAASTFTPVANTQYVYNVMTMAAGASF